jgi:acetyltransferase
VKKQDDGLNTFFYPANVAVIGVSPEPNNLGRNIVKNLLNFEYKGEILTVGIKEGVAFGQRIYRSLDQIDHSVDLAVVLTPSKTIPSILEACGRKGIKRVIIESGGFSETGQAGLPLEKACVELVERYEIRLIGPNGIGVTNMENGLVLPFWPMREDLSLGPVSILAQSGGVGLSYLGFLSEENIGLNKFVSMGNKLDVDENDLLAYLTRDKGTEIILVHLEGFTNGRKFVEIAAQSTKPILVHKANRFQDSAGIAHSHTAALFADDRLVDQALEQAGCFRVNTMAEAIDYVKILTQPPLKGNRLAVVSRSGGHAVIAADACAHYGFRLPPFPKEFLESIESRFRANVIHLQNPLDLGDLFDLAFYESIVEEMLKRNDVDGLLLGHGYRRGFEQETSRNLITKVEQLVAQYQKPVAVVIFAETVEIDYLKRHSKIPIFSAPENAMRAMHLSRLWASRANDIGKTDAFEKADIGKAKDILQNAEGRDYLFLHESLELLKEYGFPVPEYHLAQSIEAAVEAWRAVDGPVAMKINRPHISHKTDRGLVRLGINSAEEISATFQAFQNETSAEDLEILIQPFVASGREVILGGKQDDVFGPVVLFGLGGIFVETLEDVAWRLAPIRRTDARAMMNQIKGRKILSGSRGEDPCDMDALEDLLIRLSRMLADLPAIQEIDINPVKVATMGRGAQALDARIVVKTATA